MVNNNLSREPIWSEDAERAVIGSLILSKPNTISRHVFGLISPEDMYRPAHKVILEAIRDIIASGKQADLLNLKNLLADRGLLIDAGGVDYLITCAEFVPSPSNGGTYAEIVRRNADARNILAAAQRVASIVTPQNLDEARSIMRNASKPTHFGGLTDLANVELGLRVEGRPSCLNVVNAHTESSGWPSGQVSIIGAWSGGGKTALLLQEAIHGIINHGERVIYATFGDLDARAILSRIMRQRTGESRPPLPGYGMFSSEDWHRELFDWQNVHPLDVFSARQHNGGDGRKASVFADAMRAEMDKSPIGRIMVDYVQKVHPDKPSGYMESDLRQSSDVLQRLAEDLNIPVVVGTQLTLTEDGPTPKGCRAIYEDCAIALYVMWAHEVPGNKGQPPTTVYRVKRPAVGDGQAQLVIDKNRFGSMSAQLAQWDSSRVSFLEGV